MSKLTRTTALLIGTILMVATACSSASTPSAGDTGPAASDTSADATIDVTITDSSLDLGSDSISAGKVTFDATNDGQMTHEFEVFQADVDPADLPIENNVANTEGMTLMGEAEDIVPGSTRSLPLDLAAGSYIIMCNLPGHFAMGLHSTLTVT